VKFFAVRETCGCIEQHNDARHVGDKHHLGFYPLVMTNIAIENGHRNSGFSHEKWWIFPSVMLNYKRVVGPLVPRCPEVWNG